MTTTLLSSDRHCDTHSQMWHLRLTWAKYTSLDIHQYLNPQTPNPKMTRCRQRGNARASLPVEDPRCPVYKPSLANYSCYTAVWSCWVFNLVFGCVVWCSQPGSATAVLSPRLFPPIYSSRLSGSTKERKSDNHYLTIKDRFIQIIIFIMVIICNRGSKSMFERCCLQQQQ